MVERGYLGPAIEDSIEYLGEKYVEAIKFMKK